MASEFSTPLAMVFGAIIIGGAIVGTQFIGRYQIVPAVAAQGDPFVWRLDTRTGEIESCTFYKNPFDQFDPDAKQTSKVTITCTKVFKP
jgi:hypothetical protein